MKNVGTWPTVGTNYRRSFIGSIILFQFNVRSEPEGF